MWISCGQLCIVRAFGRGVCFCPIMRYIALRAFKLGPETPIVRPDGSGQRHLDEYMEFDIDDEQLKHKDVQFFINSRPQYIVESDRRRKETKIRKRSPKKERRGSIIGWRCEPRSSQKNHAMDYHRGNSGDHTGDSRSHRHVVKIAHSGRWAS